MAVWANDRTPNTLHGCANQWMKMQRKDMELECEMWR